MVRGVPPPPPIFLNMEHSLEQFQSSGPEPQPEKTEKRGNVEQWKWELAGEATLENINRGEATLRVIAGEHFSKEARDFIESTIGPEIKDPSQWLFFIEGAKEGSSTADEVEIALRIAKEKNIPVEDPIFDPYDMEVRKFLFESEKGAEIPREIVIGQLAGDLAQARDTANEKELAALLGIEESELKSSLLFAFGEKQKNPERYAAQVQEFRKELLEISNTLSVQVLDYFLRQYPDRKNAVLSLGQDHRPMLDIDMGNISDKLRLSDAQIDELLQKREKERIRFKLRSLGIDRLEEEPQIP